MGVESSSNVQNQLSHEPSQEHEPSNQNRIVVPPNAMPLPNGASPACLLLREMMNVESSSNVQNQLLHEPSQEHKPSNQNHIVVPQDAMPLPNSASPASLLLRETMGVQSLSNVQNDLAHEPSQEHNNISE